MMEMKKYLNILLAAVMAVSCFNLSAETGYDLWLRYKPVENAGQLSKYRKKLKGILVAGRSDRMEAVRSELVRGLEGMLDSRVPEVNALRDGVVIAGVSDSIASFFDRCPAGLSTAACGDEGYHIFTCKTSRGKATVITASTDIGVLYGVFHFLRLMQTGIPLDNIDISEMPRIKYRVLNHWDNLDGTIERGYAGYSLWNWERLPSHKQDRYIDYARANASIGINGVVLNNVNAKAKSLRRDWIIKASGLAEAFRPYGIRIYLTAKFSAPKEIGGLSTANPRDPEVRKWWKDKAREIYSIIPDFGGFLVKANSEGQPGPQDYGCTHAEGANMLAEALEPYGGVVFWRAFVYQNERHIDRVVTGYNEFKPLDGKFNRNVFVQPKNGPIDFQPREPFHPLFGGMPDTPLCMEVQITQENLGHAGHLVYLGTLFEETLKSDTYANGNGNTVSKILRGMARLTECQR